MRLLLWRQNARKSLIERDVALRVLGLANGADDVEIRDAYRALRTHVETRLATASPDERDERRAELRDLDRAHRAISSVPIPNGRGRDRARARLQPALWRGRLVLAWAVVASFVSVALGVVLLLQNGGAVPRVLISGVGTSRGGDGPGYAIEAAHDADGAPPQGSANGEIVSAGERARLVARSRVDGAILSVRTAGAQPEVVAEGAADETVYWLAPGDYALRVAHVDCPDRWERELTVRAGEHHEFAPEVCKRTGWVIVESNVAGDTLSIDGKELGSTDGARLPVSAGEHSLRVDKSGYESWEGVVKVEPGEVLAMRPRLAPAQVARRAPKAAARPAPEEDPHRVVSQAWHDEAMQWLLARYDSDRSGLLDSDAELAEIPCASWLGLEQSHDHSGLALSLTRFYGFDGERWKKNALGVGDEVRDLAYDRMKKCGLR